MIEQIPCLIYYVQIQSSATGNEFVQFNTYFNYLILGNLIPFSITFSFGLMAY
jgi:hypothetical protein